MYSIYNTRFSMEMNDTQRLQLQNMIKTYNVQDQTDLIRNLKHSQIMRQDVNQLLLIKNQFKGDEERIHEEGVNECNFLFTYYTDIYNKIRKDEIDIGILYKFLDVLKRIEDGELDQHEGSFVVGTILKELYIDSALKKADKLNEAGENEKTKPEPSNPQKAISWKDFKASHATPAPSSTKTHNKKKPKVKSKGNYKVYG